MDTETKVRENRLRRELARRYPDLRLAKTRRRDPAAYDFQTYMLVTAKKKPVLMNFGTGYGLTLDDVETWMNGGDA